jgi:hypothetical protein
MMRRRAAIAIDSPFITASIVEKKAMPSRPTATGTAKW